MLERAAARPITSLQVLKTAATAAGEDGAAALDEAAASADKVTEALTKAGQKHLYRHHLLRLQLHCYCLNYRHL